jgi:hypothetical protein
MVVFYLYYTTRSHDTVRDCVRDMFMFYSVQLQYTLINRTVFCSLQNLSAFYHCLPCRLTTAAVWVRYQDKSLRNSYGRSSTAIGFFRISWFPLPIPFPPNAAHKKQNKLHGLSPRANYTDRATELPRLVGEVIANFCGQRVPRGHRDGSLRPYSQFPRQEPLLIYQVAPLLYSRG